jgi:predicted ABC-type ATPase
MKFGILACGPSGVGKSSHIEDMLEHAGVPINTKLIDPDKLLEYSLKQRERSDKAYEMIHDSIKNNESFIYSASCLRTSKINEVIDEMKKADFKIIAALIFTSMDTAWKRLKKRTEQSVEHHVMKRFHTYFKKAAQQFMDDSRIDEVYLYNNEKQFSLLLSKKNKKIVCSDSDGDFYFDISDYCT